MGSKSSEARLYCNNRLAPLCCGAGTEGTMVISTMVERLLQLARVGRAFLCTILSFSALSFLTACAANTAHIDAMANLSPLLVGGRIIRVDDVATLAPNPDLLGLDDDMREFVETYTGELYNDRQRMNHLHESITSNAILDIEYEANAEGVAQEVFHRGTANCLSYANLFVALAREAGLDADYQWVKIRPQWSRVGERVAVRLHVIVHSEKVRGGNQGGNVIHGNYVRVKHQRR
jgi:hypothetical protein